MDKYDYIIVGAGLFGATFAHMATRSGKRCLVVERRAHPGGNLYCRNMGGIAVHMYGPHIFHTGDAAVWRLVTQLVPFNRFTNTPLALAPDGKLYPLPFNLNTFYRLWGVTTPAEAAQRLEQERRKGIAQIGPEAAANPQNLEQQALVLVGPDIYNLLIKGYTEKQWGRPCHQLPPDIIRRLPVRLTFNNNYFDDAFQGIPVGGYNALIDKLLEGSLVQCNTDFLEHREAFEGQAHAIVYTGPLDALFGYRLGPLEWRSLRFGHQRLLVANHQGNAVINNTDAAVGHTRTIEHKHFQCLTQAEVNALGHTVITREYPVRWTPGLEPYYPVANTANLDLYARYRTLAQSLENPAPGCPRYLFGGRLASYRYMDMAPVMRQAIDLFNSLQFTYPPYE